MAMRLIVVFLIVMLANFYTDVSVFGRFAWAKHHFFVRLFHRYFKGLNQFRDMFIYVNRGTGYWGPPLRMGVPAEITLLELRASNT